MRVIACIVEPTRTWPTDRPVESEVFYSSSFEMSLWPWPGRLPGACDSWDGCMFLRLEQICAYGLQDFESMIHFLQEKKHIQHINTERTQTAFLLPPASCLIAKTKPLNRTEHDSCKKSLPSKSINHSLARSIDRLIGSCFQRIRGRERKRKRKLHLSLCCNKQRLKTK